MSWNDLQQLVEQGESDRLEFKRSTGELREAAETLCGFLNEQGGRALFGVANNGRILGQQIADSTLQDVGNTLHRLEPSVHVTGSGTIRRSSVVVACSQRRGMRKADIGRERRRKADVGRERRNSAVHSALFTVVLFRLRQFDGGRRTKHKDDK